MTRAISFVLSLNQPLFRVPLPKYLFIQAYNHNFSCISRSVNPFGYIHLPSMYFFVSESSSEMDPIHLQLQFTTAVNLILLLMRANCYMIYESVLLQDKLISSPPDSLGMASQKKYPSRPYLVRGIVSSPLQFLSLKVFVKSRRRLNGFCNPCPINIARI